MDPALDNREIYQRSEYFAGRVLLQRGEAAWEGIRGISARMKYSARWHTLRRSRPAPGRLLEVGCATGTFLSLARERGWQVTGVEVSEEAAALGRDLQDLDIRTGTLESADLPASSFDAVLACDVLEHVPFPRPFLAEARRVLRPGGALLVQCPNFGSLSARMTGRSWGWLLPGEHLWQFTPRSLSGLLRSCGFGIRSCRTVHLRPFRTLVEILKRPARRGGSAGGGATAPARSRIRRAMAIVDDLEAVLQRVPTGSAGGLIQVAAGRDG